MNIKINKENLDNNPEMTLKRLGYAYIYSYATKQGSFVRRLTREHYPRLHLYVEDRGESYIFSLHLDQKKVSYQGSHAHSADYDGPVVETETERLQEMVGGEIVGKNRTRNNQQKLNQTQRGQGDTKRTSTNNLIEIASAEHGVGKGNLDEIENVAVKKKSWFRFF